jgi:hypothetical protein
MNNDTFYKAHLVDIDAWHDGDGWYWNNSFIVERDIFFEDKSLTTRKILNALRKWGYLSNESKGMVTVQDAWPIIEIQNRKTYEPIYALVFNEKEYKND